MFTLSYHSIEDCPPYNPSSYAWDPEPRDQSLTVNGSFLPVTRHLYDGLENIRRLSLCKYTRVNAICINQSDDVEKAKQVRRMTTIYENAERTII